jgi:uncharacterized membrane protein YhhN
MLRTIKKNIFLLFWLIVMADLAMIVFHIPGGRLYTKTLLIPVLAASVFLFTAPSKGRILFLGGLVFSFAGDIFLLYDGHTAYFISGLCCFLATHICYILYMLQLKRKRKSLLVKRPWIPVVILLYTCTLLYLLYPRLGDLKIPVTIYSILLSAMLVSAVMTHGSVKPVTSRLFILGAVFFVVSDSIFAIHKFYAPFDSAAPLLLFTYCLAQFFITRGMISNEPRAISFTGYINMN